MTNNAGKAAVFIIASWWWHRVYHYSMANYVAILKKGMDMTPGGPDESAVPVKDRLGEQVDLERRVELLVETTCAVMFNYVAQVGLSQQGSAMPSHMEMMRSGELRGCRTNLQSSGKANAITLSRMCFATSCHIMR